MCINTYKLGEIFFSLPIMTERRNKFVFGNAESDESQEYGIIYLLVYRKAIPSKFMARKDGT